MDSHASILSIYRVYSHGGHSLRPKRPLTTSDHPAAADHHDEDSTPTFTAHEKAAQIVNLLTEWHWSFGTLVEHWLTYKDGQHDMRSARKINQTDLLQVLLIEDTETIYKVLKKHSMELASTSVVNGIRNELAALRDTILWSLGNGILNLTSNSLIRYLSAIENQNAVIGFINIRAFFFNITVRFNVLKLILIDWLMQPEHLCQWSLSKP